MSCEHHSKNYLRSIRVHLRIHLRTSEQTSKHANIIVKTTLWAFEVRLGTVWNQEHQFKRYANMICLEIGAP